MEPFYQLIALPKSHSPLGGERASLNDQAEWGQISQIQLKPRQRLATDIIA